MGGMSQAVSAALLRVAIVDGGAALAALVCADAAGNDIGASDTIVACIEQTTSTNLSVDRTVNTVVSAAGYIKCSDVTTDDKLIVLWMAQEAPADQQASPAFGFALVDGALADTNIAVVDKLGVTIKTDDALFAVIEKTASTGAVVDRTAACSITSDGNIQCTDATNGDQLVVMWMSRTDARAHDSVCIRFTLATMGLSDESDITVTGIKTEDEVLAVFALDETSALPLDEVAAEVEITEDDVVEIDQVSPTVTAGAQLWVLWLDKSA